MIKAYLYRNAKNEIYGFKVSDHGDSVVCAAVSALVINTVNSIERFTDEKMNYSYDEKGGIIFMELPNVKAGNHNHDCDLLLKSLLLGLLSIKDDYKEHITVIDENIE